MSWADEEIANPMGYQYAILFPRALGAIGTYATVTAKRIVVPENICPLFKGLPYIRTKAINQETGLGNFPIQLYGYRQEFPGNLEIDPLMTGWVGRPCCESTVISFGFKKTLNIGCGGALLTNNQGLAEAIQGYGYWPGGKKSELTPLVHLGLSRIHRNRALGFERIAKWDAALGDLLPRIPLEQVMPWRVMRRVPGGQRDMVVSVLRDIGIPVGTNYPPLTGSNKWGDEVINFFPECERMGEAAAFITDILHG